MKIISEAPVMLMVMGHRLITYSTKLIPKMISNILHYEIPYMPK
jgi:hypothetical protein